MLEWALDENFNLEHINNADTKQHKYFCPECRALLAVKNRDFEGRTKAKHYAHYAGRHCPAASNGESIVHINTKLFFYKHFSENTVYLVYLKVRIGKTLQYMEYNILENTDREEMEKRSLANKFTPDISLFYKNELVKAVEIVYTHEDTKIKTDMYAVKGVKVFTFKTNDKIYRKLLRGSVPVFTVGKQSLAQILERQV